MNMEKSWCNNKIGEILNTQYPHDFSLCDVDGIFRCGYGYSNRFIIYESKYEYEKITQTQLQTLYELQLSIIWSRFDDESGLFIIRHNEDCSILKLYKIKKLQNDYEFVLHKTLTMDELYELVSVKNK